MRRSFLILLAVVGVAHLSTPAAGEPATAHFAVFNKPGERWERRGTPELKRATRAHVALYRGMAADGDIVVGGRFSGEPRLGLTVFRPDIDRDAVRRRLEADPAVTGGVIALEFREWSIQMGALR